MARGGQTAVGCRLHCLHFYRAVLDSWEPEIFLSFAWPCSRLFYLILHT